MKVFLTGGTGFIGSYIVIELIKKGHEVTVLARNQNKIPEMNKVKGIEIVEGDITDMKLIQNLIIGKDACILVVLNYTKYTGWEVLTDDTLSTVRISDMVAEASVKHFIYTSSTSVNDNVYMIEKNKINGLIKNVHTTTKMHPTTFYGATKAASEIYLTAQSYNSAMRINIIRPGYTFGNPVIKGASIQGDTRFQTIVENALNNKPIEVVKNDGTQFIWAGDLAEIYLRVLESDVNRKIYFGLSKNFVSWEIIAEEAIKRCNSKSQVIVKDRGWSKDVTLFDVSDIKNDFSLEFDPWKKILEHLDFYINKKNN